ncbi:MAG: type II/IV secretion system ATPase subunit [Thaumarchaeota archaeon]|nr:type II/IV secretion system ATPase subunit [Nitrososphaerota archaeon]
MKSFKSKKQNGSTEQNNIKKDDLLSLLKVTHFGIPDGYVEVKRYSLKPPFSYAVIAQNSATTDSIYLVDEIQMNADENVLYERLMKLLELRLAAPDEDHQEEGFFKQLDQILSDSREKFNTFSNTSIEKVKYYLGRDIAGYDIIDPLMHDPSIEDISCGGPMNPIYVWHRNFESIRTNVVFEKEDELNNFVMKMIHRSGKHVSAAFPVADISLPGNHRMAILYQKELTPKGTSFTIRKFKEEPYTIIDLINLDTIDVNIAAYLWLLLEHKMSIIVLGPTASGKTTMLNAIISLINQTYKIFTIEDVAEINIPHENWFALVSRIGFGLDSQGEIGLFDLIKAGVRHRPDYIVVGEIRGEEAYVMFQALATGHGGLCTMHADSIDSAIKRLMQRPMNIPPAYIPLMNCAITVKRVIPQALLTQGGVLSGTRRTIHVSEVLSENNINNIFSWDSSSDFFNGDVKNSALFQKISDNIGLSVEAIIEEFRRRVLIIQWMVDENIRDYKRVSSIVSAYYKNPEEMMRKITLIGEVA